MCTVCMLSTYQFILKTWTYTNIIACSVIILITCTVHFGMYIQFFVLNISVLGLPYNLIFGPTHSFNKDMLPSDFIAFGAGTFYFLRFSLLPQWACRQDVFLSFHFFFAWNEIKNANMRGEEASQRQATIKSTSESLKNFLSLLKTIRIFQLDSLFWLVIYNFPGRS